MAKFTAGQIFKRGLLKNFYGEPYKQKASITKIIYNMINAGAKIEKVPTPWGMGFAVPEEEIEKFNAHWTKYYL
jgi:hypothetical protein